ncbi:glycoside hydrolase family 127 protein [Stakelama marina]|uniref:Glycoside hydrolase family 127 protein n=1 Tax=Stakelama marina TaxID=2826939 RepID=A0A8T4IKE0_9SPHN|nr:glycoside hydrolase family 127 protein [Stakelama marina]MBR0552819.1 glycoside hydrolase family 127 protein [Stakelama marina]
MVSRRELLAGASALVLAGPAFALARPASGEEVSPVPIGKVALKPSPFADAFAANRRYLLSLDPERFLHNFYLSAGLPAPKPVYGGWESQGIAGHSLGHWLSACSLVVANTGDKEVAAKLDHALSEMARIQAAHGDGYLGGTTVERDGKTVDGKIVFEEIRRGKIWSSGFDLNGGWVPLYVWHKIHAGLLDAHNLAGNPRAKPILLGVAGYLAGVLEPLDDAQMQKVLAAEHGGLNESYANTYALTGNPRWLRMAEKIYHKAVLDPLAARKDQLDGLHANTQIPKLVGLARLYELTDKQRYGTAASFFHDTVTHHHSYVIGGNSEHEHFGPPDKLSNRITEATCEACNSYNMLKLTRHLYRWQPHAHWFDFYERVQLNHMLAHQRPDNGRFVYFMPLASGARRIYSEPEDSFWCCVGSGMESHSKHANSIYWSDPSTLYVNLYIPSELDWPEHDLALTLDTTMPIEGDATITVRRAPAKRHMIALRMPGWAQNPTLKVNGTPVQPEMRNGYAMIDRVWRSGDTIALTLPMTLAVEPTPDDPNVVAFTHGPLVLAADLGPTSQPYEGLGPALVAEGAVSPAALAPTATPAHFTAKGAMGEAISFKPFFSQYDTRTAVYFPSFTPAGWAAKRDDYIRAQAEARELARRTVDILLLGEMQPERDHAFGPGKSEVVNWNGRAARRLPPGSTMTMTMDRKPGPAVLRVTIWNGDAGKPFAISVDGTTLEQSWPKASPGDRFVTLDFALPDTGEQGKAKAKIAITALKDQALIYEMRVLTAPTSGSAPTV